MKKHYLLLLAAIFAFTVSELFSQNFYLAENGVTCMCPDAEIGDTGVVNGITYTKRTRDQITPQNASTTCTSGITNMSNLFRFNDTFNGDISSWDVSSVTNMSRMFQGANNFNQPLNNWDVSSVTNMTAMFQLASSFNMPLNNWEVGNVLDMSLMFASTQSFNQPLNNWDVSNVTNMSRMFWSTSFNGDISSWDVSNVMNMLEMFYLAPNFNQNLNDWDVSNVTNMSRMFQGANNFNQPMNNWDVSSVINMSHMFASAQSFNQQLNIWDVSNVTNMENMFSNASNFNQSLSNWNVNNVTNMMAMFSNASNFNQNLNDWNVSNVTNMQTMFQNAQNFNQPLNDWDVSNVTNMGEMFRNTSFNGDISSWDVSNVTNMMWMFLGAQSFNQSLNDWDVSNVTNMEGMFLNAFSFNEPLDDWNVSNVTNMKDLFYTSSNFNQNLSDWEFNPNVSFSNFIRNTNLSIENYDALLQSFNNQNLQNKVLNAHGLTYCDALAREDLITNKGWSISGDVTIPTSITAPQSITIVADEGTCEATEVDLGTPVVQACFDYTISNDAPDAFPLGQTQVTWTINNDAGESLSSIQIVTVTTPSGETTFPTLITAPQNITIIADEGTCEATNVDLGTPVTQSCFGYTVSNNAPDTFALGQTQVIWTIIDDAGESDSSTQIIIVTAPDGETTFPTLITAPQNITIPANPGSCEAINVDLGIPVTQSCLDYTVSNNAPDTFALGQTHVIWTITDDAGVTDTSIQTVTVTIQVDIASICYVTSDEEEYTKNRIYINNIDGNNVESYELLRETSTNVFTPMGTIAPGESSFMDETSNNTTQTYRYSLITTDICQNTSPQSPVHTTMLLQSNVAANNSINLNWNTYQGVNFGNFEIYRKINNGSFEQIATLPASNTMYNDTQANVQENSYEYYVAIQAQPCNAKLSGVQIRSNREAVGTQVGIKSNFLYNQVVLYPNPSSAMVYVQTPDWLIIEEIKLYNMTGHFITSHKQKDAINIENLSPGLYFIQIITEHGIITRKFTRN